MHGQIWPTLSGRHSPSSPSHRCGRRRLGDRSRGGSLGRGHARSRGVSCLGGRSRSHLLGVVSKMEDVTSF